MVTTRSLSLGCIDSAIRTEANILVFRNWQPGNVIPLRLLLMRTDIPSRRGRQLRDHRRTFGVAARFDLLRNLYHKTLQIHPMRIPIPTWGILEFPSVERRDCWS